MTFLVQHRWRSPQLSAGVPEATRRFCVAGAAALLIGVATTRAFCAEARPMGQIRFAVSASTLGEVNENDARAALRVWADVIVRQTGLDLQYEPGMLASWASLYEMVRRFQVDAFGITVLEYMQTTQFADPRSIIVEAGPGAGGEQYVLLVHGKRGWRSVADLKGRALVIHRNPSTCLAPAWLDTVLAEVSPGGFDNHFSQVTYQQKLSKAVLPVYFQQTDVCLVPLRSFQMMCELNPQLSRDVQVLIRSPKMVPSLVAFHRQCSVPKRTAFQSAMLNLHRTPAGKQALTLFQSSGELAVADHAVLRSAIDIVNASDRIRSRAPRRQS